MKQLRKLLQELFGDSVSIMPYNAKEKLNYALSSKFDFYFAIVQTSSFVIAQPSEEINLPQLEKQRHSIECKLNLPVALLFDQVSKYKLKRLVDSRLPFITLSGQIFLPFLGVRFQPFSDSKTNIGEASEIFSPITQLVYLYILYSAESTFTQNYLTNAMNLSHASVSRACEQLAYLHLLTYEVGGKTGRRKEYRRISIDRFYRIGQTHLINPVKKTVYLQTIPRGVPLYQSSLTALAQKTMLAEPGNKIYAISPTYEKEVQPYIVANEIGQNNGYPQIQIMKYDLAPLAKGDTVDELTLILSLNDHDERIDMAIDEMMEGYTWYAE